MPDFSGAEVFLLRVAIFIIFIIEVGKFIIGKFK
jgi:hypothetical protein